MTVCSCIVCLLKSHYFPLQQRQKVSRRKGKRRSICSHAGISQVHRRRTAYSVTISRLVTPAEVTSRRCLFSNRASEQRKTLLHTNMFFYFFTLVPSHSLSLSLYDHAFRRHVKQQQASSRTAQTKQKDLEGPMQTAEEKEKGKCGCNSVCQTGLSRLIHINLHCFSPQLNLFESKYNRENNQFICLP